MLRTDGRQHRDVRLDKTHQLMQLATMIRSHLTQEHLMQRIEPGADRAADAHAVIIRMRCLERIALFAQQRIRDLLDLKLYVDTPADIRFIRRLQRDIAERGRTVESVIEQYTQVVRPGHFNFIEPMKEYADLIIPEGGYNENAMQVLFSFVHSICD